MKKKWESFFWSKKPGKSNNSQNFIKRIFFSFTNVSWSSNVIDNCGFFFWQLKLISSVVDSDAKRKHVDGILKDKFGYHESFKTWDSDFTAVPFHPK